ncbi:P22AR C-terminal domain-containing protein [Histophilus somni]|uniref:P22AR C-terminal domain-containing protein n=1 Tax=Histophilus somni TaxID=731 RepID=UPI00201F9795|nr:P22AR C-terminal domain-containing protein [Histophilus somni]
MTTLTFQTTTLSVINQNNQTYFTANEIGQALGYRNPTSDVKRIYERNIDEFTPCMTALIEMQTNGGMQKVRIFSLRGCHLIGMLSHTKVAKAFRKWVLDILDREVSQTEHKTTVDDRTGLRNAVNMLVSKKGLLYNEAYNLVHHYMNVESIEDIPADKLQSAVEYVHKICLEGELIITPPKTADRDEITISTELFEAIMKHTRMAKKLALPEPEKTYDTNTTAKEIHDLVWLLYSHNEMNFLLGRMCEPLRAIGSHYYADTKTHYVEYKRHYDKCLPILKRFVEQIKADNPKAWEGLQYRLTAK